MLSERAKMITYRTTKYALTNLELSRDFQPIRLSEFEILSFLVWWDPRTNVLYVHVLTVIGNIYYLWLRTSNTFLKYYSI